MHWIKRNAARIVRYGIVTAVAYALLLVGTYVLVEFGRVPATPAYALILTMVYLGAFFVSSSFVFKTQRTHRQFVRYLIAIVLLWVLNNGAFFMLESLLHIDYLIAITINIVAFGAFRYAVHYLWVYKEDATPQQADA
jgi:putative flippase GtrA